MRVIPQDLCFRNLLLAAQDRKTRPGAERPLMKLLSLFTGEWREANLRNAAGTNRRGEIRETYKIK